MKYIQTHVRNTPALEKKPISFFKRFFFFLLICQATTIASFSQGVDSQHLLFETIFEDVEQNYEASNFSKAQQLIDSLFVIASKLPDSLSLKARCIYLKSSVYQRQGKYDSSMFNKIDRVQASLNANLYPIENALLDYANTLTYYVKGDYAKSYTSALQVYEKFKTINNNKYSSHVLFIMGNICSIIKNYEMAEDYYNQAIAISEDQKRKYRLYLNIIWHLESYRPCGQGHRLYFANNRPSPILITTIRPILLQLISI